MTMSPAKNRVQLASPGPAQPDVSPIDFDHLTRYTMGERALESEILNLYAGTLTQTVVTMTETANITSWNTATHTLKGSSRAVGAVTLANLAQEAEVLIDPMHDTPHRRDILTKIETEKQAVLELIARLQNEPRTR